MSLVASMMSANGRMAPADFQKAGLILIAISFVLALTPLVLPVVLASLLTIIVGLALIYPWAAYGPNGFTTPGAQAGCSGSYW